MQAARALAAKVADAAGKAAKTARKPASTPAKAQRPPKLQPVSPTLGVFLGGVAESSRQQTVKHLWDYIKAHRLQVFLAFPFPPPVNLALPHPAPSPSFGGTSFAVAEKSCWRYCAEIKHGIINVEILVRT